MQTNWLKQYYPNSSFTFQNGEIIYKQAVVPQSIRSAIEGQIGNVTNNNTTQEGGKKDRYIYKKQVGGGDLEDALFNLSRDFLKGRNKKSLDEKKFYLFYVTDQNGKGVGFYTNR
jgi:hypothetical protein